MEPTIKTRGFIALITVIIISVVLLGLVSASNTAGYFNRFNGLSREYKRTAFGLAESCINKALLTLAQNYSYAPQGSVAVQLGSNSCTIASITDTTSTATSRTVHIVANAQYKSAFSTVEAEVNIANPLVASSAPAITINSWVETK